MSDTRVLYPMNQCDFTGYEQQIHVDKLDHWSVKCYFDNDGKVRVVKYDEIGVVAGFILDKHSTMLQMYTLPNHRRKGIMKGMLAIYQLVTGHSIHFDNNLTKDGKMFYNKISKM